MKKKCDCCMHEINYFIELNNKEFLEDEHFLLCSKCKKKDILISKTESIKKYILVNEDFINIPYMYFKNVNNISKLFRHSDIINIGINKHGSLENINKKLQERVNKYNNITKKKLINIEDRKQKIIKTFMINKLYFRNSGDCYSYINYGTPLLQEVVIAEINKLKIIII